MIESGQYGRAEAYLAKAGNLPEAVHARGGNGWQART